MRRKSAIIHESHEVHASKAKNSEHDKNYSMAIIAIIAILIIVFIVSSYLQYSKASYTVTDSTGKAYSGQTRATDPAVKIGKTIIVSGDISDQYSYMKRQDTAK